MTTDRFLPYTKKIAAQIIRGIAYLHKCGVVHKGVFFWPPYLSYRKVSHFNQCILDLHAGNFLLYRPEAEYWPLLGPLGQPCGGPLTREDGVLITTRCASLPQCFFPSPICLPLLQSLTKRSTCQNL